MDSNINKLDVTNYIDVSDIKCDELGLPIANIGNIKELRYGLRPATEKKIPQVYVEKKKNKIVSHNYGHSGAGWTYLFGSVSRSIANFEEYINKNIIGKENNYKTLLEFKEKEQVAVVGMGCIGLTTALYLIEKGYKNIKLIGAEKDYITSHVAGGLFAIPPAITIDNENDKLKVMSMLLDTFLAYRSINSNNHILSKYFSHTEISKKILFVVDDENIGGLNHLADLKLIEPAKKIKLSFKSSNGKEYDFYSAETLLIHTDEYLKIAYKAIKNGGFGKAKSDIVFCKINSFDDITTTDYIFNCSGLGSKELNNDNSMYPICGHGFILKNQFNYNNMDFIILLSKVPGLENDENDGNIYFMPKEGGNYFLGGTYLSKYDGSDYEINRKKWIKLIKRARYFFNGISTSEDLPKINSSRKPKF